MFILDVTDWGVSHAWYENQDGTMNFKLYRVEEDWCDENLTGTWWFVPYRVTSSTPRIMKFNVKSDRLLFTLRFKGMKSKI